MSDALDVTPGDGNFSITIDTDLLVKVATFLGQREAGGVLTIDNGYLESDSVLLVTAERQDEVGTIITKYVITSGGIVER